MKSIGVVALLIGVILFSGTVPLQSFADVIRPDQQMKLGFTAEQVICSEGLVKITKDTTGNASCVKPATAEKLSQHGWAKQLSEKKIEEIQTKKIAKGESAGTIKKVATLKQLSQTAKPGASGISGYAYVFEACSESKTVLAPEIFVTSDSETKSVKLESKLNPNSCYTSSVIIKAADPDSISATLLNKGEISEKVKSLETQIADLKEKISLKKQKIPTSDDQNPDPANLNGIISMKKELKDLQDQLRRYLMVLYVPPSVKVSDIDIPKSISGKPLEGLSTDLISVTESLVKPAGNNPDLDRFNVVFEACSGKETVRLPIITVISDSDEVTVKLIERIIPNSCQVGVVKINAVDSETITTKITGNSSLSKEIVNMEKRIEKMQSSLADKKSELNQIISKQMDRPTKILVWQMLGEIRDLRDDLLENRTKLYGMMLNS